MIGRFVCSQCGKSWAQDMNIPAGVCDCSALRLPDASGVWIQKGGERPLVVQIRDGIPHFFDCQHMWFWDWYPCVPGKWLKVELPIFK